jgi:hypothetical protein
MYPVCCKHHGNKGVLMKKLLVTGMLLFGHSVYAEAFKPESGLIISCEDSVSGYGYLMKIVDIGDHEGAMTEKTGEGITQFENVLFNESRDESFFTVYLKGKEHLSIIFPSNNLAAAYYVDTGDSRGLDCEIIKLK